VLTVTLNSQVLTYSIANITLGSWYSLVVSVSNEFRQCGVYVYSIMEDPSDITNHNALSRVFASASSLTPVTFNISQYYTLPTSNMWIANIRVFNTMIKEEQHEFIISQQFIKDESLLVLIDNCRQQINLPYIAKNR